MELCRNYLPTIIAAKHAYRSKEKNIGIQIETLLVNDLKILHLVGF